MKIVLDGIGEHLAALRRDRLNELLLPGLPRKEVTSVLSSRGLRPSKNLLDLYEWHNGTDSTAPVTLGEIWFLPGCYFARMRCDRMGRTPEGLPQYQ